MAIEDLLNGLRGYEDVVDTDSLPLASSKLQRRKAVIDALRKTANTAPALGSMVSGHYVPNFMGLAQQATAGLNLPGEQRGLDAAEEANRVRQIAILKNTLQQQPEAPGDQSNGPPIPGQLQDQMQGNFGASLLENPLTEEIGSKILSKALTGGYSKDIQTRQDSLQDRAANRELRQSLNDQNNLLRLTLADKAAQAKLDAATIKANAPAKPMSPKDIAKLTGDLGNRLGKEGKDYGEMVDAIDRVNSLVADNIKSGQPLTAPQADSLIYAYNKVLDPHSVVREGEYARTTGQNPALDRIGLWLNQVKDGKVVATPELAKQMTDALQKYSAPSREKLYALTDNYVQQARAAGVNPYFVVSKESWRNPATNYDAVEEAPISNGPNTIVTPGGEEMPTSFKDAKWDDIEQKVSPQFAEKLKAIRLHGEKSNSNQVSSVGARTPYQITPETRRLIQQKYGFDAWASPENAVRAAEIVYKDGLNKGKGERGALDHYSGGHTGYADRVLKNTAKVAIEQARPKTASLPASGWSVEVE